MPSIRGCDPIIAWADYYGRRLHAGKGVNVDMLLARARNYLKFVEHDRASRSQRFSTVMLLGELSLLSPGDTRRFGRVLLLMHDSLGRRATFGQPDRMLARRFVEFIEGMRDHGRDE